jgi:hypothetical protein
MSIQPMKSLFLQQMLGVFLLQTILFAKSAIGLAILLQSATASLTTPAIVTLLIQLPISLLSSLSLAKIGTLTLAQQIT